ncbi:hypothetical protein AD998_04985 [bacterium 336/3]|nr:hypothetical protein AD998_04985 [bacterium 336/3]
MQSIDRKNVLGILDEIQTTGHSPLKVIADDNQTYFIKNYGGILPAYYLCSEIICNGLLSIWQLPTPQIILLDLNSKSFQEKLLKYSKKYHKAHYYDNIPAVGSLLVEGNIIELNTLTEPSSWLEINTIENKDNIWKIGLFDIWVENDDRKPSNPNTLIQHISTNRKKVYALDHAFCFNSIAYKDLHPDFGVSQSFNDNILFTNLAKELFKKYQNDKPFRNDVESFFKAKVEICRIHFCEILDNIPIEFGLNEIDKEKLYNFLFHQQRNKNVLECFFDHIEDYA